MSPRTIEGPKEQLYRVPLVRVDIGDEGPQLTEVGTPEWLTESFIRKSYGAAPDRLRGFRVSGDAMSGSLQAGDRTRGILWEGESLIDGAIYVLYSEPGGIVYRRVRFESEKIRLVADHPDMADRTLKADAWHKRFRPVAHILEIVRAI
ncbi:S24 family peptidase [Salinibacter ruber]|uniref:S24 family peptidase n=1 Tax=Salinibacter ruber TaxID=146919 RepID=UPI0020736ADA|nr:S24 family peptidase [Salinibacter ruber]